MKSLFLIFVLILSSVGFSANEIVLRSTTAQTDLYAVLEKPLTKYLCTVGTPAWDSTPTSGEWGNYNIALTEDSVILGAYYANMPALSAGLVRVLFYKGASPAKEDTFVDAVDYYWTGTVLLNPAAVYALAGTNPETNLASLITVIEAWMNGGALDVILDAILEDTGTTLPAAVTVSGASGGPLSE